ncbi:patatin-like phospholipase family protein [Bradyrhizobium brasilense]|uniref:patatin-like phospholipase family protein n=1 Tax=Bradyrhizobium brasilense TaxID=1419277 RepID=UPI00145684FA|nr:patatin-like phospholipase family protein [Bradyrhizobium brasilense]NLS68486.1 patatin-like phospholipase family protein [Bradyrhizobium brasilense]
MDARTPHFDDIDHARPGWRPEGCDRVALVLQGGGALGAYQAGVYQALHESNIEPDWVCGVSIGAINSAIIAGNPPEKRLERLHTFWDRITSRKIWHYTPDGDVFRKARNFTSSWLTTTLGQPGFFTPHQANPWFSPAGARTATSYYDTTPLRESLLELVDFDRINSKKTRFAVGAVNVLSGNFIYFDNAHDEIIPEHIMASGALPPALPMVKVGTDHFWDGGIVSNTPLQHLLDQEDNMNSLVFQVDLFSARGALPRDIQDVMARHKDIMYSSRTRYNTDVYRKTYNLRTALHNALGKIPDDQLSDEERQLKKANARLPGITLLQLIYQQKAYEGDAKDHEFSGTSMREHWVSGHEDTKRSLKRREWIKMPENGMGIVIHDVHREAE